MGETFTTRYALMKLALDSWAPTSLTPFDTRMLVALSEFGGEADTLFLEKVLIAQPSSIRRSMIALRNGGYIVTGAVGFPGATKRGVRATLKLTPVGANVAVKVLAAYSSAGAAYAGPVPAALR